MKTFICWTMAAAVLYLMLATIPQILASSQPFPIKLMVTILDIIVCAGGASWLIEESKHD